MARMNRCAYVKMYGPQYVRLNAVHVKYLAYIVILVIYIGMLSILGSGTNT